MYLIVQIIHFTVKPAIDDVVYALKLDEQPLLDYLNMLYHTYSSRLLIEGLFVTVNRIPVIVWMFLDSIIYTTVAYLISKLFNKSKSSHLNWLIVLLVLLYPFYDMYTAGYVTTTIAYVWPMCGMLYTFFIMKKTVDEQPIKLYQYLLLPFALIIAISMEQSLAVILGFTIVTLFYLYINKKLFVKKNIVLFFIFVCALAYLIFALTAPGPSYRVAFESDYYFPGYADFSVITKLYLGIVPTMGILLNNGIVIGFFGLLLACAIFAKTKSVPYRVTSLIVAWFFIGFGILKNIVFTVFPHLQAFYNIIIQKQMIDHKTIYNLTPLFVIIAVTLTVFILLFKVFDNKLLPGVILAAALCSRIMIGFSPTIFASSTRTAFIMYFGIIILILLLFKEVRSANNSHLNTFLYSFLIISVVINVLNILYHQLSVFG